MYREGQTSSVVAGVVKTDKRVGERLFSVLQTSSAKAEPLMPTSLPDLLWQKVGTDLFEWKRSTYLLVIHAGYRDYQGGSTFS